MKHLTTILFSILLVVFLSSPVLDVSAQMVKVKREAVSPGRRIVVMGPNYISTGLRVFARGMKVYFSADTTGSLTTPVTSFNWSLVAVPTGSAATITGVKDSAWFIGDSTGQYIVKVDVNGGAKSAYDTLFASTYMGWPASSIGCQTCHAANSTDYTKTNHATMFMRGITGQIEVDSTGRGAYAKSCVRCHTTGWESVTDNGNFGYIANQTKWDSTWWKGLPLAGGDYWIPWKDMTLYNNLTTNYPTLAPVATIGCESCHGPGKDHNGDKTKTGVTFDAGICMQCHDAPNKHRLGSYWKASAHATMPLSGSRSSNTGCWPCHNGPALAALQKNQENPDYSKIKPQASISCQSCHDPHSNVNENQLRIVKADSLLNKYAIPEGIGGKGQLCMVCHRSRYDATSKVEAQTRVFGDRFYPHYSPQADMFVGTNAYEYGQNLSGLMTHSGVENACVTCHMSKRVVGSSVHSNHEMKMMDANGKDIVTACRECHGKIEEFNDIRAMADYDGNGKIEGVPTEITGMLDKLKALLPKDANGEPVTMRVDSMKVKNDPLYPKNLGAIWNYYFVKNDWSNGVHNTKYAVAILRASFAALTATGITPLNQDIPENFALSQNYPNPFNPSTQITFAIPRSAHVRLAVYNTIGERVVILADGELITGNYTTTWNGLDASGKLAASGVYFYRLETPSISLTKKMMMIK